MRRCHKCDQFFKVLECICPHCNTSACENKSTLKAMLVGAGLAAATVAAACGENPEPRPLYGVAVFPDAGNDGG
jgi:hypothetical protein